MQEFEKTKNVNAAPDQVFNFVAEISNLPQYLPTVRQAEAVSDERIRVQGEVQGHRYDETGFLRSEPNHRRLEWGSDDGSGYHGWLQITDAGQNACSVVVHLSFADQHPALEEMDRRTGSRQQAVNEGLENALQSIKNLCEGRGGKVQSARQR